MYVACIKRLNYNMTLSPGEKLEYDVLSHIWGNIDRRMTPTQHKRYYELLERLTKKTDGGRPKPSQKRPTARRLRSSKARKVRKARATRRK